MALPKKKTVDGRPKNPARLFDWDEETVEIHRANPSLEEEQAQLEKEKRPEDKRSI